MPRTSIIGPRSWASRVCWSELKQTRAKNRQLLATHRIEKLAVGSRLTELVQQQFHRLHWRQRVHHFAQNPHAIELFLGQKQLFLTRTALVDIDRREHALIDQLALQVDFHIAGALELFEDHII